MIKFFGCCHGIEMRKRNKMEFEKPKKLDIYLYYFARFRFNQWKINQFGKTVQR